MELNDHAPRGWYSRGYLPHFDGGEIPQSVTFRLVDSLPNSLLRTWEEELVTFPKELIDCERRRRIESYLDLGMGYQWLGNPEVADVVENALLFFDDIRYHLHAWVVMSNHIHCLITPKGNWSLSKIIFSWKSFIAKEANRLLAREGQFWDEDYFDRFIRDDRHFENAVRYIEDNPVKAGLIQLSTEWRYSSARRRE